MIKSVALSILLVVSLLVNGALWFGFSAGHRVAESASKGPRSGKDDSAQPTLPAAVAWQTIYSKDTAVFTANLRAAGVSEPLIRAFVEADIDRQFAAREKALLPPEKPRGWWQLAETRLPMETQLALLDLRREKAKLRNALLGPSDDAPDAAIYDHLPIGKREQARMIVEDYNTMLKAIRGGQTPMLMPAEREKIKFLQTEMDRELSELLTPEEIAEHKMRTSLTTENLRHRWGSFEATEEEYRAIYAIKKRLDDTGRVSPADEKRVADELKQALGEKRGTEAVRALSHDYQSLCQLVQNTGLAPDVASQVFDLRDTLERESARIAADSQLTGVEKVVAVQALAATTREKISSSLGTVAGPAYLKSAAWWLREAEQGNVVSFTTSGSQSRPMVPISSTWGAPSHLTPPKP